MGDDITHRLMRANAPQAPRKRVTRWMMFKYRCWVEFRRAVRMTKISGSIALIAYLSFILGQVTSDIQIASADTVVHRPAVQRDIPPILEKIAAAESGDVHKASNGQIVYHANKDGSIDLGRYQINLKAWGATASKMGYDLTKEQDNEAFALWLFENKGSEPWYSSARNWKK